MPTKTYLFFGLICSVLFLTCTTTQEERTPSNTPNIILIMADDQGWGDVGYNGNDIIKTPNLDAMASEGIQFNRFYAAAPVCSPTRASCLTGRHPMRLEIPFANSGHLKTEEINIAEVVKQAGYTTGHFGKWHLGVLTNDEIDANRGGRNPEHYAPPWEHGFDVCFSTESKVPTWNPMITPGPEAMDIAKRVPSDHFGTYYWTGPGIKATENLEGANPRIIIDRVIPFVENAVAKKQAFLAVIWFHTPHLPVLTGDQYKQLYAEHSEDIQQFYGAISAMDEQIGRLRETLSKLGAADNTMLFYTSDNGPEGKQQINRTQGSTNGLRGRKRSLYEGGIRVPGIWVWPNRIKKHQEINFPVVTSDYYPTILDVLGLSPKGQVVPLDGISLAPILDNKMKRREKGIGFESRKQRAFLDSQYKLFSADGEKFELYDLSVDAGERNDLSKTEPDRVEALKQQLETWRTSVQRSAKGLDY